MKFLIVFALALSTTSASRMANSKLGITYGNKAAHGQFPYQVGLSLNQGDRSSWCGGSLIGYEWVLTAAHCTDSVYSVTVYLGATDRTKPEIEHDVSNRYILIHPGWNRNVKDDISLIKIPYTYYTPTIQPIRLPPFSSSNTTFAGNTVVASGWGSTTGHRGDLPIDLQWARMGIITNDECARHHGLYITPSIICVSTPRGVSTCFGDSGGPLVLEASRIQIGVSAFVSYYGCTSGHPSGFTRVTSYLDWIRYYTGIAY